MTTGENDSFDDVDDLDAYLADERAADKLQLSSVADAQTTILAFASSKAIGAWPSLDRQAIALRLLEIVTVPRTINQGALNLCGPAAFFAIVAARHPVSVASAAIALFETGKCALGGLHL